MDNKKAIEEFCGSELEYLKQNTLVEQTSNPEKMHIYFIVEREIPNKSSSKVDASAVKKINANAIPALEIKSNSKGIMFCSNSPHQKDGNYQIKGTLKPEVFPASMVEERISRICKKYNIFYGYNNNSNSTNNQIHIEELFKPQTKILEGHNRHEALLRVMESLLQRNKKILSLDKIKQLACDWNQEHCIPPLEDVELDIQWGCASRFVTRSINDDDKKDNHVGGVGDLSINTIGKGHDEDEDNHNSNNKSIAETLVKLALTKIILFNDQFNIPHSLVKIKDHYDVLPVEGTKFKRYLSKLYYDSFDGKIANSEAISNAVQILEAKSIFEGQTIILHLRTAWADENNKDAIFYDLSDDKRRCIKITKDDGWKIVENPIKVLFKRYGHQISQVEPLHEYDNGILDNFIGSLNIKNENHKLLIKVWVITLLIPDISRIILLPYGPPGSAKSTFQKKIQMLIDPNQLDLLSINNDKNEFIQQVSHNYLCFYDNISHVPRWLPDEACRVATGGATSKRKLYTDDEDIPYKYKRPQCFAGINVIFTQEDVLDRSIKIELDRIDRKKTIPDDKIEQELNQQIPQLLGYIFDILAKALGIKDSINLSELPRMADFAEWGEAIARALGYKPLAFIDAYFENIDQRNLEFVESDPFAEALSKFIDYEKRSWISSPKIFANYLREFADNNNIDSNKFPKAPQTISYRLNKIKPILLEGLGIEVIIDRITTRKGNSKNKLNTTLVKIRKRPPASPASPTPENDGGNEGKSVEDLLSDKGEISNISKRPPAPINRIRAQIIREIDSAGDAGDTGDDFRKYRENSSLSFFFCHYCDLKYQDESALINHSINSHPGEIAQPDESILKLDRNYDYNQYDHLLKEVDETFLDNKKKEVQ